MTRLSLHTVTIISDISIMTSTRHQCAVRTLSPEGRGMEGKRKERNVPPDIVPIRNDRMALCHVFLFRDPVSQKIPCFEIRHSSNRENLAYACQRERGEEGRGKREERGWESKRGQKLESTLNVCRRTRHVMVDGRRTLRGE